MKNPFRYDMYGTPKPWWWDTLMVLLAIFICAAVCGITAMVYLFALAAL